MSMYSKTHYNIVISLQLKKKKRKPILGLLLKDEAKSEFTEQLFCVEPCNQDQRNTSLTGFIRPGLGGAFYLVEDPEDTKNNK